jgi:hypothetical protein
MAQTEQTTFIVEAIGKGFELVAQKLDKTQKKVKQQGDTFEKTSGKVDKYGRRMRGAADMSSNATKNFSKMQQGMEGGGSGGLVRAYALLAANVFALSAAFGILSRAAQVDTLVESMKQLEVVSGQSIRSVARDLQEAAGFGMDFANAMRSTSLALSAGFESEQILQLGVVARNAAVSLGRNLPDALDRIFRGVIKVEPELLDEIGLFVRVNEAAAKFASSIGVAAGELTEFQKRQAFLNESLDQGTKKFAAFSEVEIDPFARLATVFADFTQDALTFIGQVIKPIVSFIANNSTALAGVFIAVGGALLRMVIPAMGQFALSSAAAAEQALQDSKEHTAAAAERIALLKAEQVELANVTEASNKRSIEEARARSSEKPVGLKVGGRKASRKLELDLQNQEIKGKERLALVEKRILDIETNRGKAQRMRKTGMKEELKDLKTERDLLLQNLKIEQKRNEESNFVGPQQPFKPGKGTLAEREAMMMAKNAAKAQATASVAATTEFMGFGAGMASVSDAAAVYQAKLAAAGFETTILGVKVSTLSAKFPMLSGAFAATGTAANFLKAGLFRLGLMATVVGVQIQAALAPLMPLLLPLTLLISLGPSLLKLFGFFSEEQSALKEANKGAAESFELLTKKIEHATQSIRDYSDPDKGLNFKGIVEATLALKETNLDVMTALDEQIDAFEKYKDETNIIVQGINRAFSFIFNDTAQQQIRANTDALIKSIQTEGNDLTAEMQKLVTKLTKMESGQISSNETQRNELRQQIIDRGELEVKAFKNVKSSIDGAIDSARAFGDSLITKTQVDKPLATFKQITSSIQNAAISEKERKTLLDAVVNDTAILSMLTEDQRKSLKAAGEDSKERLIVLEDIEESFARQQELIIRQKTETQRLVALQKQISKIGKLAADFAQVNFQITNQRRKLEGEGLKRDFQRKVTQTGLTEERVRELSTMGSLVGREKELGLTKEQIAQVQTAISAMVTLQTFELDEQVRLSTEFLDIAKARAQADAKILATQINLTKEIDKGARIQAKIDARAKRGSSRLTGSEEITLLKDAEDRRRASRAEDKRIQELLAGIDFDIVKAQMEVLKERAKILADEQVLELQKKRDARIAFLETQPHTTSRGLKSDAALELERLLKEGPIQNNFDEQGFEDQLNTITNAKKNAVEAVGTAFENETKTFKQSIIDILNKQIAGSTAGEDMLGLSNIFDTFQTAMTLTDDEGKPLLDSEIEQVKLFETVILNFAQTMTSIFGEQGAFAAALGTASANLTAIGTSFITTFENAKTGGEVVEAIGTAVAASLAQVSQLFSAYNQQQIAEVDSLIEAEKRRDGKSKESLARIAQMEKKKENLKRKEFETNKKLMMAQTVASTAAGIAAALPLLVPPTTGLATALIGMIGAMGAAQLAIISKLKYNAAPSSAADSMPTSLTIGNRSNRVDVSQQTTAGELNYLRGGRTTGGGLGGAGGAMGRRGYADGGIVVGERGPEVISPSSSVDITPNFALGGGETNVNFTIQAMDASGVEDVLTNQRGNIIRMIREAANENGERFLETVDTQTYGSNT